MPATVLVADDDPSVRTVVGRALTRAGYEVKATGNAASLWRWVESGDGDLVLTDMVLPDGNGLDLIPRITRLRPDLRVIVMSAKSTLSTALKASERGAFEYLPKPFDLGDLTRAVARAMAPRQRAKASIQHAVTQRPADGEAGLPLIGRGPTMQEVYRALARLVNTDLTVMITGESGTGKELVAHALHSYGNRRSGPFVAVNLAATPRDMMEQELFGAVNGAPGRFAQARGGVLFLDEVGDIPLDAQTRLLRVLQDGEVTPVGSDVAQRTDVRIVAATHRDLRSLIRQGLFREDLFYRLNVVPIRLPPLRDRAEDIPELVAHFMDRASKEGFPSKTLDAGAMEKLAQYPWPGNVRELENLIRRLVVLSPHEVIGADMVAQALSKDLDEHHEDAGGPAVRGNGRPASLQDTVDAHVRAFLTTHGDGLPVTDLYATILREVERPLLTVALERTRGNQIQAARMLGLNRNTLRKKLKDLDIMVVRGGGAQ